MVVKKVLITGFGPFKGAENVNLSWEGVQAIDKDKIESQLGVKLYQEQIEVKYKHVDEYVPMLWEKYQPDLVIHVGIAEKAPCFQLEKHARRKGYRLTDMDEALPEEFKSPIGEDDHMKTMIEVDSVCEKFNSALEDEGLQAQESDNAGKYICEYTYYTSLCQSPYTLLVHVPKYKYSEEQIARGLESILEILHEQLRSEITRETFSPEESESKKEAGCCCTLQ